MSIFKLLGGTVHDERGSTAHSVSSDKEGANRCLPTPTAGIVHHITGTAFNVFEPNIDHLNTSSIGRVMSRLCRFGGHTTEYYSVGQHSVLVAALSPKDMHSQRWALLHDANECFSIPDILTPLKPVFPELVQIQDRFMKLITDKYGLSQKEPSAVKFADHQAFALEVVYCMSPTAMTNGLKPRVDPPNGISIDPLNPKESEDLVLAAMTRVFEMNKPITLEWLSQQNGFKISPELIEDYSSRPGM